MLYCLALFLRKIPAMKKYSLHFLILTFITATLGFSGFEFPGDTAVRLISLISGIGLMVSCLDSLLISHREKRDKKMDELEEQSQDIINDN
jgi:uncharacterized membrane protein YtjA (UPF0391 family)